MPDTEDPSTPPPWLAPGGWEPSPEAAAGPPAWGATAPAGPPAWGATATAGGGPGWPTPPEAGTGHRSGVSRRAFLAGAAGVGVAGAAALALTHNSWGRLLSSKPSTSIPSASSGKRILVL